MKNVLKSFCELLFLPIFLLIFFGLVFPIYRGISGLNRKQRKPRIIWGPTPIISINTNSAADRIFDYKSDTLVYRPYYIINDFTYNLERFWKIKPLAFFIPWGVFLWSIIRYDIFQFYYDGGFLQRTIAKKLEFPLLKLLGKKIIVSAYGADVRVEKITRSLGKYNCCMDCKDRFRACICDDTKAKSRLIHVKKYADVMLSMGDMIEYTPGSRNDIFYWAIDLKKWEYIGVNKDSCPVKIVHAPNHPQFKGTRFLQQEIEKLQKQGYPIELILITKMSNEEAKEYYKQADIVGEQFIIGWHGNFAVEAMALGKPLICYIRKPELYSPQGIECPIVNANPDNLRDTLITLIENPDLRYDLGVKGRQYVEEVFSQEKVGARMDRIYQELWSRKGKW